MNMGNIIRAYRAKNRIFQSDLAKQLDITNATLSRIETNKITPNADVFFKFISLAMPDVKKLLNKAETSSIIVLKENDNWLNRFSNVKHKEETNED